MRIRTQFIATLFLFGALFAAIGISAIFTNQRVDSSNSQRTFAASVSQGAGELSYLANDYVIYRENQQLERWQGRFTSFSRDVAMLNYNSAEQQALVGDIHGNTQRIKEVFESVVSAIGSTNLDQRGAIDPDLLKVSWSRSAVQSQTLLSDASRLSELWTDQVNYFQRVNNITVIVLIGVFIAYFLINFVVTQRRALQGLAKIQMGTAFVASGDLDFKIDESGWDEIGDLSRSFNRMTDDLKTVTTSKYDLEREIIERKRVEEDLEASNRKVNEILASIEEDFYVLDQRWNFVYANTQFTGKIGKQPADFVGKNIWKMFPKHVGTPLEENFHAAMDKREIRRFEITGEYTNAWYRMTAFPSEEGIAVIGTDITESKKADERIKRANAELEASNKELEAFSYSVSHDLRAPLRSMEGFSSALVEDYADKLDDQGKQYLRYVKESSDLMARLIDDLLKLSRVTRSEMNYDRVNLSELAREITDGLKREAPERRAETVITPDVMVNGDHTLLRAVLENLIGNAWKFSGKVDSPRIEFGVIERNGKQACFVRDNGTGFDMTYADRLFKPFQRLHKASDFAGTGIGLATVQRIIRRHGGEVWAESKIGEGATFYFTLG
jgi:PAS domain S-box-containing protein